MHCLRRRSRTPAGQALRLGVAATLLSLIGCGGTMPVIEEPAEPVVVVMDAETLARQEAAIALLRAGRDAEAEAQFTALAERFPQAPTPRFNLAALHLKAGRHEEAVAQVRAGLPAQPRNAAAYNLLGVGLRHLGRFREAEEAYLRALVVDPDYPRAHYNLAQLYELYLLEFRKAVRHYERYQAQQAAPDPQVAAWIADARRRAEAR
jgi:Flp pilus assembly protein TadD